MFCDFHGTYSCFFAFPISSNHSHGLLFFHVAPWLFRRPLFLYVWCCILYLVLVPSNCLAFGTRFTNQSVYHPPTMTPQPWASHGQPFKIIKFRACLQGTKSHQNWSSKNTEMNRETNRIATAETISCKQAWKNTLYELAQ